MKSHSEREVQEIADNPCRFGDIERCAARCETDSTACNASGLLAELRGTPEWAARAAALYRQGCDDDYPPSCNNLAWLYAVGRGVPRDPPRSMQLFARAYDGYRIACGRGDA